ncbi:CRISPR-associated helicase/endonuclease Cas3 [Salinactinospora qingdaonensis]|uniref:CRISPR-associated helicase/endonuclease Cas3 n=1 Tax=Salinactinospora qingdaonensis TaxID=702744 RepID=A0ABP7FXT6_9ACTN
MWRHMADSAGVAGRLWDEWVPTQVRRLIVDALPGGAEDARRLAVWLAATHDIGKATPAFACQVEGLAEAMRRCGLDMPLYRQMPDRKLAPHGLAGQLLLQQWLVERHGWPKAATGQFVIIAGGHHGVPPNYPAINELGNHPSLLRTRGSEDIWRGVQDELLDVATAACGVGERLAAWQRVKLPQPVQVLLTALVIVADWIASNPDLFPYFPGERGSDPERLDTAWRELNLPAPWAATEPTQPAEELFAQRFDLPEGARIRPVQREAVRLARELPTPGLLVIEAPMGEGKTEAALAAAEIFAARSGAGGCFVALPTMATGNAMFPRLLDWLERLPDERADTGAHSVALQHSKAALNRDFAELMRAGRRQHDLDRDGTGDAWRHSEDARSASAELVAHHWLRGRKKAMLSSFVVGTIDQLLFAGLKSRHLALRHLAVAGKVVVIDEAHAYDTYMSSYLARVLEWLGAYGVPVVVLSATLPPQRRRALAAAYSGTEEDDAAFAPVEQARDYPLLTTAAPGTEPRLSAPEASGRGTDVAVERLADDLDTLADRLAEDLAEGGCAVVVRNTVNRVHETAAHLRRRFGDERVTVAHARFLDLDRLAKDEALLADFGPPEKVAELGGKRPHTRIVVASQVVEQSLDIDFDLMVSDLAPVDLLLQRMGRLHRHPRGEGQSQRPRPLRTARCLITGVDWETVPPEPVAGSQRIYYRHPLLRSLAVLDPYLAEAEDAPGVPASAEDGRLGNVVGLPGDISPLVRRAYGDEPVGPPQWQEAMATARKEHDDHQANQRSNAGKFLLNPAGRAGRALVGWIDAGMGDADETRGGRAQVRDINDTLEVLVVQRRADGTLATVPWLADNKGGRELPTGAVPPPPLARTVAACGLRLPYQFSFSDVLDRAIEELEAACVEAWQAKESYWLAGELILVLDEDCRASLAGFDLHYTPFNGLEVHHAQ